MKLFHLLIFLTLAAPSIARVSRYAKPGYDDMCGNVRIPFPFGMGANCYVNEWYSVDCNSSVPYLSALNNVKVLDVNLERQTVTVNVSMISDCGNPVRNSTQMLNVDLDGSPFLFSSAHNQFVVEGCGNAVILDHGGVLAGCSIACGNDTIGEILNKSCIGITCCQTAIPYHLKSYTVNLTGLGGDKACRSALLVDKDSYREGNFSVADDYVPVSFLWTLSNSDFAEIRCCNLSSKLQVEVDLGYGTSVGSWKCLVSKYQGNPYLTNGCQWQVSAPVECSSCEHNEVCINIGQIYDIDGLVINEISHETLADERTDRRKDERTKGRKDGRSLRRFGRQNVPGW